MTSALVFDIESYGDDEPFAVVARLKLPTVYDLSWTDPEISNAPADTPVASFERKRRFKHCGAAIAWARRQIFHGRVFGESIQMAAVHRVSYRGVESESEGEAMEITLAGFCRWQGLESYKGAGMGLTKPERKCRISKK